MIEKCEIAYQEIVVQIDRCRDKNSSEQEQAGHAYKIAMECWQQVKLEMKGYQFSNKRVEIDFYKNVKPKFTGYIEFLMLVNYGLQFLPVETGEPQHFYWQCEMKRLDRFMKRNKTFVEYYHNGSTQHDLKYFVGIEEDVLPKTSKAYDADGGLISTHDHLVASLLAEQKYHEFAKKKLND